VDDVQEIGGDGVVEPGENDAVHARPRRIVEVGGVAEDVILQGETTEDEEHVATPLGVVGVEVKNDGNEVLDVLDGGGLAVEVSDGSSLGGEGADVVVVVRVLLVAGGLGAKAVPESRGLLFEEVRLRALLVEGLDGGADAVLGRGGGLEEVGLRLEFLAALRVGGAEGGSFVFELLGGGGGFIAQLSRGGGHGRSSRDGARGIGGGGRCGRSGARGIGGRGMRRAPIRAEAEERI